MLSDITFGQFYPGRSFVHRLDPRTKILGTLIFVSAIFLAENYLAYLSLIGFTAATVASSRLPVRLIVRAFRPLLPILFITLAIHLFMTPGEVLGQMWFLTVTYEGLRLGVLMSLRLILLIVMSSMLTYTTSPIVLTDGIERLLRPFRRFGVPAHEIAMMMTIALRFIPTLLEETDKIIKAQTARGADFASGHLFRRARNMVPLLVPLFVSAFRRADELATAMEARCYRGGESRTRLRELKFCWEDGFAAAAMLALVAILSILRFAAPGFPGTA